MKIAIAGDHAGFELKEVLAKALTAAGHDVQNLGTHDGSQPSDYPDFALSVGEAVSRGDVTRGILVCGSGVGVSVAANKIPGVRAALCHDTYSAHQGVEHDDMNVLCLGARIIGESLAKELVAAFVGASFSTEERHARRLGKVRSIEERYTAGRDR
ncbi:ribose 5-phosphate isomerase B [Pendulispora albinea]|uniref:Ribose 5-phosphate isomerase B n=1 Tax=Pendulispora albinea TaxID=2741071 RepID=A0ABZ2LQ18_9BACT